LRRHRCGPAGPDTERSVINIRGLELVVADQDHPISLQAETAHAVHLEWRHQTITHGLSGTQHDGIGEPLRQIEQAEGICCQRAMTGDLADIDIPSTSAGVCSGWTDANRDNPAKAAPVSAAESK